VRISQKGVVELPRVFFMPRDYRARFIQALVVALAAGPVAVGQFSLQGPGVLPGDFRVTTFATGLNFPVGMTDMPDGSVLVAVSNGGSFATTTSGSLVRLVDSDFDGVADVSQTLVSNVSGGRMTAVRRAGNLVVVTGQGATDPISFYRLGALPSDPLTYAGQLTFNYPISSWSHKATSLLLREAPGQSGQYELYFQIGSRDNFAKTTQTVSMGGTLGLTATLAGDAIHRVTVSDTGTTLTATQETQIATGLRNPSGLAFHPTTGDFYIGENGIDGTVNIDEPISADEINVITLNQLGTSIPDFGFPNTYEQYRTGTQIGSTGVLPLMTFQPIPMPNGSEAEGVSEIAFAPPSFPSYLRGGLFAGFHGRFTLGGVANEENPVVFVNLGTGARFEFIGNGEPAVGHPDGFLSTSDTLFISDMSPTGALGATEVNTGKIYAIRSLVTDLPGDYTNNRAVNAADYVLWRKFSGTSATLPNDTTIGSGPADYDLWRANFGRSSSAASAIDGNVVPEPAALWMLAVATGLLVSRAPSPKWRGRMGLLEESPGLVELAADWQKDGAQKRDQATH
jgi:glucose/arabinose dehydrogenase